MLPAQLHSTDGLSTGEEDTSVFTGPRLGQPGFPQIIKQNAISLGPEFCQTILAYTMFLSSSLCVPLLFKDATATNLQSSFKQSIASI